MRFFLILIFFNPQVSVAQSSFGIFDTFLKSKTFESEYESYKSNPGIDSKDLAIYQDEVATQWDGAALTKESVDAKLDLQFVYDINFEAASIWQALVACQGEDIYDSQFISLAIKAYFEKRILCGDKTSDIKARLIALHSNVKTWIESVEVSRSLLVLRKKISHFPPLHPLLGQVLIEAYSYYKSKSLDILSKGHPEYFHLDSVAVESAINYDCHRGEYINASSSSYRVSCKTALPYLNGFTFTSEILDAAATSCTTFGFLPNRSINLFASIGPLGPNKVFISHPSMRNQYLATEYTHENFIYEHDGYNIKINYLIYWDRPIEQRIVALNFLSGHEQKIVNAANEDYLKKFGRQTDPSSPKSCWKGREHVLSNLNSISNSLVEFNKTNQAIANFFASYFTHQ